MRQFANWNGHLSSIAKAQAAGVDRVKTEADQFSANIMPVIREAQRTGASSLRAIADVLNARGVRTVAVGNGLQLRCETSCGGLSDMGLTEPHGMFGEPAKQPRGKNMIVAIL